MLDDVAIRETFHLLLLRAGMRHEPTRAPEVNTRLPQDELFLVETSP